MKTITLPLLNSIDTAPMTAYKAMQWTERSAIIRQDQSQRTLVTAATVVRAVSLNWVDLSDANGPFVYRFTQLDASVKETHLADPTKTQEQYQALFDSNGTDYLLLDAVPGLAQVVVRDDVVANRLAMAPKACYCEGPDEHEYPPPTKNDQDDCDDCEHQVRCVSDADQQPKPAIFFSNKYLP
jgi:hypothetical protein